MSQFILSFCLMRYFTRQVLPFKHKKVNKMDTSIRAPKNSSGLQTMCRYLWSPEDSSEGSWFDLSSFSLVPQMVDDIPSYEPSAACVW